MTDESLKDPIWLELSRKVEQMLVHWDPVG
jgi:hypothetical protein